MIDIAESDLVRINEDALKKQTSRIGEAQRIVVNGDRQMFLGCMGQGPGLVNPPRAATATFPWNVI